MHRNLPQPPHSNMVQGALSFEAGKYPLDGRPLAEQCLPLWSILVLSKLPEHFLVPWVYLDDGLGAVLLANQVVQGLSRVSLVSHHELRITSNNESGLPQDVAGPLGVVNITGADVSSYRKFTFTVYQQVQLVTQDKLGLAVGVLFHRPLGLRVRRLVLAAFDPSLEGSAVYSYPLPESRQFRVAAAHQRAGDLFDLGGHMVLGELSKEAAESRFVGNSFGGFNPTSLSDEGVVSQCARVSFGATACWAGQRIKEGSVVKPIKKGLKLGNDWRRLNQYRNGGIISVRHWKMYASFWLGAVGVDRTCGPALFRTSVLNRSYKVNRKSVRNDGRTPPIS